MTDSNTSQANTETQPPVKETPKRSFGILDAALVLLFLFALVCVLNRYQMLPSMNVMQTKIVVLDTPKLLNAKAMQSARAKMSDPSTPDDSVQFMALLRSELLNYQHQGYIVIASSQALAWPQEQDITPAIAAKLGLNLAAAPLTYQHPATDASVAPAQ